MKTGLLLLTILFSSPAPATENLFKTEKEVTAAENKKKRIKEVPQLAVTPPPSVKPGPEINCTTDTGETLGPKDKGHEQCLIDSKKPTKVKGR